MKTLISKGPEAEFTKVYGVVTGDGEAAITRVHSRYIDRMRRSLPDKFHRHDAVCIVNRKNGRKVVRTIAAAPPREGYRLTADTLGLDYNARDLLRIPKDDIDNDTVDLVVRRASALDRFRFAWNHENLTVRYSMRGMVTGVALGVIGVALGVWSLYLTLA